MYKCLKRQTFEAAEDQNSLQLTGSYAGALATAEIGVGSLLHAFHLPFSGYLLSLNQVLILSKAVKQGGNAASISSIASILKTLSPMGKKLTPMLAIAMQGILFQLGVWAVGNMFLGRCLGACLSSTWGFIQPIILYYLIFGSILFDAIFKYIPQNYFYIMLILCIALKCCLSIAMVVLSSYISINWWERFIKIQKITRVTDSKPKFLEAMIKSFGDMIKFPFLLSLGLTGAYLFALEGATAQLAIYILRTCAIGFIFFFILRIIPLNSAAQWLEKKPWKFAQVLRETLKALSKN